MEHKLGSPSICMLVGNGLLFDYLIQSGFDVGAWHPQRFSEWKSPTRLSDGRELWDLLPHFSKFAAEAKSSNPALSDFEVFDALQKRPKVDFPTFDSQMSTDEFCNDLKLETQARHFVSRSIAWLQANTLTAERLAAWRWTKWFSQYADRLSAITSFNYDTICESALDASKAKFYRAALVGAGSGTMLHKPHGSVDFECSVLDIEVRYPLENLISRNNTPIRMVSDILGATIDAEIVLPSEASTIGEFQWVQHGARKWRDLASKCDHLIIAGLSYWECDRPELDDLVASVPVSARIHFCNPNPSEEWLGKLQRRFTDVVVEKDGPPTL